MGRPKTPIEKMAVRSPDGKTPGKRNLPAPYKGAIDRTVPEPPIPLTGRALDEWDSIWIAGFWLQRDQDYHWVEMIAKAYRDMEAFQAKVEEDGLVMTGYAGQVVAHPLIAEIRRCETTIQKCLQVLGFSPTDRAKLAIRELEKRSKLQQMMDRGRE
jgi:P27 family predicted phage terminase small subunit